MKFNELWTMTCSMENCTHEDHGTMYIHSRCHIKSPTWTYFNPETGELVIECAKCKKVITRIQPFEFQLEVKG